MRVTTQNDAIWGMESLARFLNLDLDSVDEKDLANDFFAQMYLGSELARPGGRTAAKQLQTEVKQCLRSIVAPEKQFSLEEAYALLWDLVKRGNKAVHKPQWVISPVEHRFFADEEGRTSSSRLDAEEIEKKDPYLRPGQRVVQFLGYRWFVGLDYGGISSLQGHIYGIILEALERAELTRLRVCGECQKFFVQGSARQEFCSDRCRSARNNRRRLASGYFSDRRHKERERQLKRARRALHEGKPPARVAKETGLSLRVLQREGLV